MLNDRQKSLLKSIVEIFVREAAPLASSLLSNKLPEKVSSATIRNELADLEAQGFIYQPHTSAGRIPTNAAYEFYVRNYLNKDKILNNREAELLLEIINSKNEDRQKMKDLAMAIAELSKQGVMVAFSECDSYHTGISNIFSQPEFHDSELVVNLSGVIDHLETRLRELLGKPRTEPEILIGANNPLGDDCSLIVFNYDIGKFRGIIALLGPVRMDYQKNYTLLKECIKLIE